VGRIVTGPSGETVRDGTALTTGALERTTFGAGGSATGAGAGAASLEGTGAGGGDS